MIAASQMRPGAAIRYEGQPYKVLAAEYHPGQGKMGGQTHARLLNLNTGTTWELSLRSELKVEEMRLEKRALEFLYADETQCCFMDPGTFEQTEVPRSIVGERARFLETGMRVSVEFLEERAVGIEFPDAIEVKVADTAPPLHQQADSTFKTARLENGVEILVPQFIKTGDAVRVALDTLRYMDRVARK
ncbi:MAG: translation elongation factor P [Acidobacteria bacterium]|nr:translation elongation factor P [Acidobacteriota bacterium]